MRSPATKSSDSPDRSATSRRRRAARPGGPRATIAAFGSISPPGIRLAFDLVARHTTFEAVWHARDAAVLDGLRKYAPAIVEPLSELGPQLWPIVEALPRRAGCSSPRICACPRPDDPVLSGWHAVNCLREWRGDLHWALVAAAGLDGVEASVLHNAWLGYERDWLPVSRGTEPAALDGRGARSSDAGSSATAR